MTNEDHGVTVTEEEPPPAKCPVLSGAEPTSAIASTANQHWWPNQLNLKVLNQHPPQSDPLGADFDYAEAFNAARPGGAEAGPGRADDRLAGVVAGRLRPLRRAVRPHGVAQRRHVPDRRRPRRRRRRHPALRPAEQLAGQRQPGQGPPPALADQAEVRPADLVGRPDDPRRQLRHRVDGAWPRSASAAAASTCGSRDDIVLGPRGRVARRRALPRRPRAGGPARRPCRWA